VRVASQDLGWRELGCEPAGEREAVWWALEGAAGLGDRGKRRFFFFFEIGFFFRDEEKKLSLFLFFFFSDSSPKKQAAHLARFNRNFRKWRNVSFPRPLEPLVTPGVLVESFESG